MSLSRDVLIVGAGAAGLVALAWYVKNHALPAVGAAVNPLNPNNVFSEGASGVVQVLTGDKNQTLGGWFNDLFGGKGLGLGETMTSEGFIRTPAAQSLYDPSVTGGAGYFL